MTILLSVLLNAALLIGAFNVPAKYLSLDYWQDDTFGALSYTTLTGTEQLANFPTLWNATLASLDTQVMELSDWYATTSAAQLTTLANLSTVGTITSGNWNGTAIPVAYNGTGTTSPTSNQVMIGNGSSGFKVVGFGNSGEFLTSGGAGVAPSWTAAAINQAANYSWTGFHSFTTGFFSQSTSTHATTTTSLGLGTSSYLLPAAPAASTTMLSVSGSSPYRLSWVKPPHFVISSDNSGNGTTQTSTTTVKTVTIPAGTLGPNDTLDIRTTHGVVSNPLGATCFHTLQFGDGTATTTAVNDFSDQGNIFATLTVTNKNSLTAQSYFGIKSNTALSNIAPNNTTYNTANAFFITISARTANASQSCGLLTLSVEQTRP